METVKKYAVIIGLISTALLAISIYFLLKFYNEKNALEELTHQNELALASKIELLETEKSFVLKKVAFIEDIKSKLERENSELLRVINMTKGDIASLVESVARLSWKLTDLTATNQGFEIPKYLVGKTIGFEKKTSFYDFTADVTLDNPSKINELIKTKPFSLKAIVGRDDKGVWSGVIDIPKEAKEFFNVDSIYVSVGKNTFLESKGVEDTKFHLSMFPSLGTFITPELHLTVGGGFIINKSYMLEYLKTVGVNQHTVKLSYIFSLF